MPTEKWTHPIVKLSKAVSKARKLHKELDKLYCLEYDLRQMGIEPITIAMQIQDKIREKEFAYSEALTYIQELAQGIK